MPLAQPLLASEQAKSSTWATPLPVSAAAALTVRGSGDIALTYEPPAGEDTETVGGLLSTRTPATTAEVVVFPARSTAVARRS